MRGPLFPQEKQNLEKRLHLYQFTFGHALDENIWQSNFGGEATLGNVLGHF